ncbi:MAG: asparaginase [Vulcanimicrobiota bacterium]
MSSKVCILYTGGTFGMTPSMPEMTSSPLAPADKAALEAALDGAGRGRGIDWELHSLTVDDGSELGPLDSSAVGPEHWLAIAASIERLYSRYDGFVVIHGTDTLAYTASALSFLLVNLAKPVVVTGSQRPIFFERTDAHQNFLNALYVAGYKAVGLPCVPEVTVCFGDHLLRGNRTRKISVEARAAFSSPNYPALGTFGASIHIDRSHIREVPSSDRPFYVHRKLEDRVMDLTLYPGVRGDQLRPIFERDDIKGFVLRTFGSGTTPRDPELLEAVARAARQGTLMLVVTQCVEGSVDLGRYDASTNLLQAGVVSGFDLTPETALTKLMWILSLEQGPELNAQVQVSHRGEQTYDHHHLIFEGGEGEKSLSFSGRPSAPFARHNLQRALLRVSECENSRLTFFLNASGVDPTTSAEDVRSLGAMNVINGQGVLDVTRSLQRLMVENRPLRLTVTAGGEALKIHRVDLSLLVNAEN